MSRTIDFRSDTVTLPPPEMRRAMYEAELGDDVYGEDPTVNALQERAAELVGKEAGLFVTSGTQGNLVSILTHCTRGDEIVLGDQAHILHYEVGGASALAGAQVRTVPNRVDGTLDPAAVAAVMRDPSDVHNPYTRLVCLENTQNLCGGVVLSPAYMREIGALAHAHGASLHLDGARLFNAAVAQGISAAEAAGGADTVTICASKGLAAPVGSVLCGSGEFIDRARRWRKMVGGGMRQAGVIAAGALFALNNMVDRLADDHRLARLLAEGLAEIRLISLNPATVQTNIVVFDVAASGHGAEEMAKRLNQAGVLCGALDETRIRLVTHFGIEQRHVEQALIRIASVMREL